MSLEESINRLASAIEKLNPASLASAAVEEPKPTPRGAVKPKAVSGGSGPPAPPLKYEDVRVAILDLGEKKGIDAAIEVLTRFGVKHAKGLLPAQYPEALEAVQKALAA